MKDSFFDRLFADLNKISNELKKELEDENVQLDSYEHFYSQLKQIVQDDNGSTKFCVNPSFSSYSISEID